MTDKEFEEFEKLINSVLCKDKVIKGILSDIEAMPDCQIVANMKQDQHFKNRKLAEIRDLLKS